MQQAIDKAIFPGMQGGPLMHTITAKAVCFEEALKPSFKVYSQQIVKNAKVLAETLMNNGLRLVSGGTDNHLMLLDLTAQGITGLEAENALGKAGITVNKNTIPNETKSPFVTSGLRVGTPAVTSRGMKEAEMRNIGNWIATIVKDVHNEAAIKDVHAKVTCDVQQIPDLSGINHLHFSGTLMVMILDGKKCSEMRLELLKEEIEDSGLYPRLATVIVGSDPASQMYVRMKHRACEQVGIGSVGIELPEDSTTEKVLEAVTQLNRDDRY